MNEEKIIKRLKNIIEINKSFLDCTIKENSNIYKDIQGLLDLYNKEKRNNLINETHIELFERSYKELAKKLNINSCIITENIIVEHIKENYISKDKIKEKLEKLPHWLTEEEVRGIKFFANELLEERN